MDRWIGKVAVVTGASAGIGAAIVVDLANAGLITIGLARRQERIDELTSKLADNCKGQLHSMKCDVSKENEIVATFKEIERRFGGIDVLVNNAGIVRNTKLTDADNSVAIQDVVNTNLMGLIYCTREAVQTMKKRSFDGHIININSIAGHYQPMHTFGPIFNVYYGSKHAVTAVTETLRQEFIHLGTKIKVTSISPGAVLTEIGNSLGPIDNVPISNVEMAILNPEDISSAVLYALGTPPHVQIHEMIIKPVGEKF